MAVGSLIMSVGMTVAVYANASQAVTAAFATAATVFFFAALLEALALVGTMMRHGLYRAELTAREIRIHRQSGGE